MPKHAKGLDRCGLVWRVFGRLANSRAAESGSTEERVLVLGAFDFVTATNVQPRASSESQTLGKAAHDEQPLAGTLT